jgi:hypothetical protein
MRERKEEDARCYVTVFSLFFSLVEQSVLALEIFFPFLYSYILYTFQEGKRFLRTIELECH